MKANRFLRSFLIVVILILDIGCDQVSKAVVRHKVDYYYQYHFFYNHFSIARVENSGAFLSLGDSLSGPLKVILLNAIPFIALMYGLYFIFTKTNIDRFTLICLILIIGGGFGNLYDRVVHGSVTDFMHIQFGMLQTGVFNVADMSITGGVLALLVHSFFKKKEEEASISSEDAVE